MTEHEAVYTVPSTDKNSVLEPVPENSNSRLKVPSGDLASPLLGAEAHVIVYSVLLGLARVDSWTELLLDKGNGQNGRHRLYPVTLCLQLRVDPGRFKHIEFSRPDYRHLIVSHRWM
jgi:hypothetical protein